jgi:hypothetical protein
MVRGGWGRKDLLAEKDRIETAICQELRWGEFPCFEHAENANMD